MHWPPLPPGNIPSTQLCWSARKEHRQDRSLFRL